MSQAVNTYWKFIDIEHLEFKYVRTLKVSYGTLAIIWLFLLHCLPLPIGLNIG